MTNDNHPITPPPKLILDWMTSYSGYEEAARWGADLELDLCVHEIYKGVGLRHIDYSSNRESLCSDLRAARRPKPPSLKQQALEAWEQCWGSGFLVQKDSYADTIRRALEALPDD